jgi:hypothetical protein
MLGHHDHNVQVVHVQLLVTIKDTFHLISYMPKKLNHQTEIMVVQVYVPRRSLCS